jgi:hypothetical protein
MDRSTRPDPAEPVFDSSEALVESMLGRQLIPGEEYALVHAARQWLSENACPRQPHARGVRPRAQTHPWWESSAGPLD